MDTHTEAEKRLFIDRFVACFLANWCVQQYEECCNGGDHDRIEHPPVEDAVHIAECAWDSYVRYRDNYPV